MSIVYQTDLNILATNALEKEEENDHFLRFVNRQDGAHTDELAHDINNRVSTAIDCTACGNCCKTLVINVTGEEVAQLSKDLHLPQAEAEERYIETSHAGRHFINTVPCAFLSGSICSIYRYRFTECRDFPHLHKPGFKERLLGTLLHYGRCPIIYNVVEEMKVALHFKDSEV
jgi:Fe-S-cluster containining protein